MLKNLIINLASYFSKTKIHQVHSQEEREAIYRFRYQTYIKEFGFIIPENEVDHTRGWVYEKIDEEPNTVLFYAGKKNNIQAVARVQYWEGKNLPAHLKETYSLEPMHGIEKYKIAETSRFIVKNTWRGKLSTFSIIKQWYRCMVKELKIDFNFSTASPGLLHYYKKMGYRPYPGNLIQYEDCVELPIVFILNDTDYLKKIKSFLFPLAKEIAKPINTIKQEEFYKKYFMHPEKIVISQPKKMIREIELFMKNHSSSYFNLLSKQALHILVQYGLIINVNKNIVITREGRREKELFIILSGQLEISIQGKKVASLDPGHLIGELAFFIENRTATIYTTTEARLFVIRRHFLDHILKKDPAIAAEILISLGKVMADKLKNTDKLFFSS